eukprot:2363541-Rhodomonas_salina.1
MASSDDETRRVRAAHETPFASATLEGDRYIDSDEEGAGAKASSRFLGVRFQAWRWYSALGGSECPEMLDQEEGVFGDVDELQRQRQEKRHGLRQYLLEGQAEWKLDGGVVWKPPVPDPAVEAVRPIIARAEK